MSVQEVPIVKSIYSLPDEIVSIILKKTINPQDILNFAATCKQYNDIIKGDQSLWKYICEKIYPPILYKVIEQNHNNDWLQEMKYYTLFKQEVHAELMTMSAKHYWSLNERSLDNVDNFFNILTKKNFFYAICILQDVTKTGNKLLEKKQCIRPYTLTDMYYSSAVLAHLMQTYLTVTWFKANFEGNLSPELVVNFFVQWTDPGNLYLDEDVHNKINSLADEVNHILETDKRLSNRRSIDIIDAVTQVIYKNKRLTLTIATDLGSLDICKVTADNTFRNVIVAAVVYQAVATRCGAYCELIVFPNHLYVEWTDMSSPGRELYNIDLGTGQTYPKRQCPFASSHKRPRQKYSYSADSLLQYIYASYFATMGALITWNTQNALQIQILLGYDLEESEYIGNPYKRYLPYLLKHSDEILQSDNLKLYKLSDEHIQFITSLGNLNRRTKMPRKKVSGKKHIGTVKFAVGMICYHKKYDYVCVVRGWDAPGHALRDPIEDNDLIFGQDQPFYYVTAADQSDRYVAQENLKELTHTTRLYHLELQISKDFTHFDGFAYIPNEDKEKEYPDDQQIVEVYRVISQQQSNNQ